MLANALLILLQQEPNVAAQTRERRRERLAAIKKSAGAETKVAATHTHVEHLNKCLMAKCLLSVCKCSEHLHDENIMAGCT